MIKNKCNFLPTAQILVIRSPKYVVMKSVAGEHPFFSEEFSAATYIIQ